MQSAKPDFPPDFCHSIGNHYEQIKRGQDVILSTLLLLSTAPVMLLLALVIWLESPGANPIFSQIRVGKNGKEFRMYKLRTMVPRAEDQLDRLLCRNDRDGPAFKMRKDPRVTRVGAFLRKTCLDELPQLWNVLRGDMSMVGPRPALPREVIQYDDLSRRRLRVLPGLTCYWQILPQRNDLPFEEWMALDRKYIRERSIRTDLRILLATIPAVFRMNGL